LQTVLKYLSFDNEEFNDEAACRAHEKRVIHKRLIGLTRSEIEGALAGEIPEIADALETVGVRIMRARIANRDLKRPRNAALRLTHQPEEESAPADDRRQEAEYWQASIDRSAAE